MKKCKKTKNEKNAKRVNIKRNRTKIRTKTQNSAKQRQTMQQNVKM